MNMFQTLTYDQIRLRQLAFGANIFPSGVSFLDDALGGIAKTDLTLLGGRTGTGKTQLAVQIARRAAQAGKTVHFFALEADENEIEERLLYSEIAKAFFLIPFSERPKIWLRYSDWRAGKFDAELQEIGRKAYLELRTKTYSFNRIYRGKSYTVDDFIAAFEGIRHETDFVVIDHLHFFDLLEENENQGLKRATRLIRSAALDYEKPVLLLAQLRKADRNSENPIPDIDDFYGHSDLVKTATGVILLAKDETLGSQTASQNTYAYIAKSRHAGDAQGYAGLLSYNLRTNSYDDSYYLAKVRRFSGPELLKSKGEMPKWARNALEPIF